jgi:MraZ protein
VQITGKNEVSMGALIGLFTGTYTHSLDPKKRLTIPSEWRDQAGEPNGLYVLPDLEGRRFLNVFPAREMSQRLQSIRNLSIADVKGRQFARLLGSQSQLAPWDAAGRIRINDGLLDHARLAGDVLLVGVFDHFELWNPEQWKAEGSKGSADLGEAARYVGF